MPAISIDRQETIDLLKSLIAINSVNPSLKEDGPGEREIGAFIRDYMENAGLETHVTEIQPNRCNVVGILRSPDKRSGRTLMLNGHTDTVSTEGMDIDPFDPVEKDGKIYGRGSADMKAGVAAILAAAAAVARAGVDLQGDLIVAAVADEEYASIGTEALVKKYTADAAIVTEPTGLDMVIAHKGFAWVDIRTTGRAAHGSLPAEGIDAIMMMGDVMRALRSYEQTTLASRSHPMLGHPSLHASIIQGGEGLSTYPDACRLQVERRTIPGETRDMVLEEIERILDRCRNDDPKFKASADLFFFRDALEVDRASPVVQLIHTIAARHIGREPAYTSMSGWLDSGILCCAGIPTVVFGPGGEGAHAAVEFAYTDDAPRCAQTLADTVVEFCGVYV